MAATAKALSANPRVQPDSLSLLEAAFSHYGLSPNNGKGNRGFFRDVIEKQVVKGPFISTYSVQDTVVGIAYSVSSRLAGDNTKAVGDANDQYGGIGRNGTQRTPEANNQSVREVGDPYAFRARPRQQPRWQRWPDHQPQRHHQPARDVCRRLRYRPDLSGVAPTFNARPNERAPRILADPGGSCSSRRATSSPSRDP